MIKKEQKTIIILNLILCFIKKKAIIIYDNPIIPRLADVGFDTISYPEYRIYNARMQPIPYFWAKLFVGE